jgi:hypothetical protein
VSERQWKRIVRVTFEGSGGKLTVENLAISFNIARTIGSKQNTAGISIWNLTASHRKQLGDEFDKVTLECGYEGGNVGVIFKGNVSDVTTSQDGADILSEIECGDGDKAIQKGGASKTFPAGTKPKVIVEYLARTLPDVTLGEIKGLDDLPATKRPYSVFGHSWRELDTLGRTHAFYWSIQNGEFIALKADRTMGEVAVISKETGMIGPAEVTDKGVKVKCLLNPTLAPGKTIRVRSAFLDEESGREKRDSDEGGGLFRIASVTFEGGNRQEAFYAAIEANRVSGGKVTK